MSKVLPQVRACAFLISLLARITTALFLLNLKIARIAVGGGGAHETLSLGYAYGY